MYRLYSMSLVVFFLLHTYALADVVVIVRREAQAAGNYVRICDIARVEGPEQQAQEVARTVIGPTPPRGTALEITRWDIETRLYELGVDAKVVLAGNESVRVLGDGARPVRTYADQVPLQDLSYGNSAGGGQTQSTIARPLNRMADHQPGAMQDRPSAGAMPEKGNAAASMQANAKDRLAKTISHYLAAQYNRPDIEIESQVLNASGDVPYSAHLVEVANPVGGQVPGKATLQVRVQDNPEDALRLVTVDAQTSVFGLAPVAAKQLSKDEIIVRGDIAVRRVRMESGKSYLPPREDALIGRKMKRSLRPGEPLLAVDTEERAAVKQGDEVVHDTTSAGWRVTGTGKALGSGQIGDMIQVQDSATKKKFDARVTGPGTVSVIVKKKVWE